MAKFEKKENPMTERIPVRCTQTEKDAIRVRAELAGLSMSEYLRNCGLGRRINSKVDIASIGQLQKFGGLLKHLYSTSNGTHDMETKEALDTTNALLKKMLEDMS